MKIRITEKARELYGTHFPISTNKCNSFEELDYKVQRMVDLGKKKKCGSNTYLVQYYNHQLQVVDNQLVNIQKTKNEFDISEKLKRIHYNKTFKVVV